MPFKLHSLTIGTTTPIKFGDLLDKTLDLGPDFLTERSAGEQFPDHVSHILNDVGLDFTTFNVKILDTIGVAGLCLVEAVNIYLQNIDECGKQAAAGHRSYTVSKGLLTVESVTCAHRENARAACRLSVVDDGAGSQVTIGENATLPTDVSTGERWTLGPETVGGVSLGDYTNFALQFQNNIQKRGTESDINDKYIEAFETSPEFQLDGIDSKWFAASGAVGEVGIPCEHADTLLFLRKRDPNGAGFVPNLTAEHLQFTAHGVAAISQAFGATANDFTETMLRIVTARDGAGAVPVIFTSDVAIP